MRTEPSEYWRRSRDVAHSLYRAAIQAAPLTNWSRILSEQVECPAVDFTMLAPSGKVMDIGSTDLVSPDYLEFMEHYQFINPLYRFWCSAPEGEIIHFDQRLVDEECRKSAFYSRYKAHLEIQDNAYMLFRVGGASVLMHVRLPRQPSSAKHSMMLLGSLRQDLSLMFELAGAFLNVSNTMQSVIDTLDHEGVGVAVLSSEGRLEKTNDSMNGLLRDGEVLRSELGRISAGSTAATSVVPEVIRRTAQSGHVNRLCYNDGGNRYRGNILASAVPSPFGWGVPEHRKIVMVVTDSSRKQRDLTDMLRQQFSLTATETRVAERLHEGRTSNQIAVEFGVQPNCIRSHLKAIFAKTGTHSQVELLSFLQQHKDGGRPAVRGPQPHEAN